MLIINTDALNQVKQKILSPESRQESIQTVKRMLEIKQTLLWRAEAGNCCSQGGFNLAVMLSREVDLLEDILKALENNDEAQALSRLDDYILRLEKDYGSCYTNYCQS